MENRRARRAGARDGAPTGAGFAAALRRAPLALHLAIAAATGAAAPAAARAQEVQSAPGDALVVYLMTMGPGELIYESFGHNALWIRDQARGTDVAYNYGMFDMFQPGFVPRLVEGKMRYWTEGFDGPASARYYASKDRSVLLQELNLTPAQRVALRDFLEWNALPENRFYDYDYYRDNCSTRVRDALDRALGGQLRSALEAIATGTTYRTHTQRLTTHALPAYTGLLLAMGHPADEPLDGWEESFIPMRLAHHLRTMHVTGPDGAPVDLVLSETVLHESSRPAPPETSPEYLPLYIVIGLAIGGLLYALGTRAPAGGAYAIGFAATGGLWTAAVGFFGILIGALWSFTGHVFTYGNENLLQVNPLPISLAILIPFIAAGVRRLAPVATLVAAVIAVASIAGLLIQLLPGFDQSNGEIIALVLPAHLALAWSLYQWPRAEVSLKVDGSEDRWRERAARASGRYR